MCTTLASEGSTRGSAASGLRGIPSSILIQAGKTSPLVAETIPASFALGLEVEVEERREKRSLVDGVSTLEDEDLEALLEGILSPEDDVADDLFLLGPPLRLLVVVGIESQSGRVSTILGGLPTEQETDFYV